MVEETAVEEARERALEAAGLLTGFGIAALERIDAQSESVLSRARNRNAEAALALAELLRKSARRLRDERGREARERAEATEEAADE